jgi:hypothetical protein
MARKTDTTKKKGTGAGGRSRVTNTRSAQPVREAAEREMPLEPPPKREEQETGLDENA